MNRKLLRVIFYPSDKETLFVPANEIVKKIGASKKTHLEEFHIIHMECEKNGICSVIDRTLTEKKCVDLVLWNPMPLDEIEKLEKYNPEIFGKICLCSVNHNFTEEQILPQEKEWRKFFQTKKH